VTRKPKKEDIHQGERMLSEQKKERRIKRKKTKYGRGEGKKDRW